MKTVFKKTLIATAALAFVGSAFAADIRKDGAEILTATKTSFAGSFEGLVFAESVTTGTGANEVDVLIKPRVTNVEQDVLVITISGAPIDVENSVPVLTAVGGATGGYEFFDFQGTDTIRFRVKNGGVPTTAADLADATKYFSLDDVILDTTALTSTSKITVASKVVSLNPIIGDYDKGSLDVVKVQPQSKVTLVDSFDQEIATAKARKEFTNNDSDADFNDVGSLETVTLTLVPNDSTDLGTLAITGAKSAKIAHVFAGDWSFVRDADKKDFGGDGNGTLSSDEIKDLVTVTSTAVGGQDTYTYSLSADNSKLTVTQTVAGDVDTALTLVAEPAAIDTPTKAASASGLNATTFKATITATTEDTSFAMATNAAVGAWTIDGSVVKVPYLVLQDGRFGTIVTVSNSGSGTGDILLDIVDDAGVAVKSALNVGSSTPGSIKNVSGAIRQALVDAGKDITKLNKFSVTITTNVPAADIIVYSAYTDAQNGGERAIVNNDSQVQDK